MPECLRVLKQAVLNSAAIFVAKLEVLNIYSSRVNVFATQSLSELQCKFFSYQYFPDSYCLFLAVELAILEGGHMIEYHNPDAPVGIEETPYELSLAIDPKAPTTIGLLANGFPDSVEFLNAVGDAIRALFPSIRIREYNKGNATIPAGNQLLQEMTGECAGVIAAYGH